MHIRNIPRLLVLAALLVLTSASQFVHAQGKADPLDWTFWRGNHYNGSSTETGLIEDWDPDGGEGSNVLWQRDDLGSRSTPVVMDGLLYTIVRADPETAVEGEKIVCVDAATGKTIWEERFNVWLSDVPDTRVGWSSVTADPETGNIYALGVCGYFQCRDGKSGELKWAIPLHERFGLLSTYGGRTNFPVICDDLVIISAIVIGWGEMAKPAHRFIGFDKRTGEVVWFNGTRPLPYDTTYSSPTVAVVDGQKVLIFGSGDGAVWGLQPRTGKHIWKYNYSKRGLNVSPLLSGNTVFTGHSEENIDSTSMGSIVALTATGNGDITTSGAKWRLDGMMMGKSSPIIVDKMLFCFDDRAKLWVYNTETGEQVGRRIALGTVMRSSPLYADGKIYAITANGRWYILKPDADKGAEIVNKGRLIRGHESHASPICSHGRVYIPTTGTLYCLEDTAQEHGAGELPAAAQEAPVADDDKATHVQIVPAEMLLKPGETKKLAVRLFNARGQYLKDAEAEFSVMGPGEVVDGAFKAGEEQHVASVISAKVGDLTGTARVRVVPALPWNFDFSGLKAPPITWVGARYRHVIREVDGNPAMVKVTTIPKGTRSRCWFGHSDLNDYTIQADVRGAITNDKRPDIGLIAQGYTMDLKGESQQLQIRSWVPQLRMAETIDFPWEPNKWYTMKFSASVVDGKAVLKGKVWVRGEAEPQDWTIEASDDSPNLAGSPGLFGNAKDAEITLDNISVTANN